MITENLSTLKIHKLTQAQYERERDAGRLDENALYLTPDEEVDFSNYATIEQLNTNVESAKSYTDSKITEWVGDTSVSEQINTAISSNKANWNASEGEEGHIEGRTHWMEFVELLPNTSAIFNEESGIFMVLGVDFQFVARASYTIIWNGTPYTCVAVEDGGMGGVGNSALMDGTGDTGEPFFMAVMDGMLLAIPFDGSTEVTIGVSGDSYQRIDKNYLPEDTVYGDPVYTKPAFDLQQWFYHECEENPTITFTTNSTVGGEDVWENIANTTNEHWQKLIEIFQKYLLLLSNGASYETTIGNYNDGCLSASIRNLVTGGGTNGSYLAVEVNELKFRWSDTDNCIQRSCIVTERVSASATVERG